ncbi:hypothetical protein [Streptomyces sp. NPDC020681]|uniref:hypothetical protein n=1 Tax=Streptomyces sp. NPDC020681 TaxID=3365083 RepID=UPI00379D50F8
MGRAPAPHPERRLRGRRGVGIRRVHGYAVRPGSDGPAADIPYANRQRRQQDPGERGMSGDGEPDAVGLGDGLAVPHDGPVVAVRENGLVAPAAAAGGPSAQVPAARAPGAGITPDRARTA